MMWHADPHGLKDMEHPPAPPPTATPPRPQWRGRPRTLHAYFFYGWITGAFTTWTAYYEHFIQNIDCNQISREDIVGGQADRAPKVSKGENNADRAPEVGKEEDIVRSR